MKDGAKLASVTTRQDANRFRRAARLYAKDATRSKDAARRTLVRLGIYTKKGKLSQRYK